MTSTYQSVRTPSDRDIPRRSGVPSFFPNVRQQSIVVHMHGVRVPGILSSEGSDSDPGNFGRVVVGMIMPIMSLPHIMRTKLIAERHVLTRRPNE